MLELTQNDKDYIWQVVEHAADKAGSYANLFANRIEFFETTGRIKFDWPSWMLPVKDYLIEKYGKKSADALLLSILREVMAEPNYSAYLRSLSDRPQWQFEQKTAS